ncbi:Variant surface glycoprotein [Trypanosoma congolense IL3000]|uniref:Variant surface glycoprotein n=1 Tax=Trypanosoma congolense (strain IL3000) TaxID=1068625 RepID=F9WAS7_TRYCI|nr:Variant surface glycoprotein [Trypanosoma congolense IL3000]
MMMRLMRVWMVAMLVMLVLGVVANGSGNVDHNGKEHDALCDFLKVAVDKWKEVKTRDPEDPLRKALKNAIFGYESAEEELESWKKTLPQDYKNMEEEGSSRTMWCGQQCQGDHQASYPRWPGHSAPHDMVCLCTKGSQGRPVNNSNNQDTLCGNTRETLGSGNEGWTGNNTGQAQMSATWNNVVTKCLEGGRQKSGNLKEALNTFTGILDHKESHGYSSSKQLGEGTPNEWSACTGSPPRGVCVMYYPEDKDTKTWWVDLQNALIEDDKLQNKRAEEETRKKEEAEQQDSPQMEALKSGHPPTNQTDQHNKSNLTDTMRKLNLTGSSSIILPPSWLLRAVLLI